MAARVVVAATFTSVTESGDRTHQEIAPEADYRAGRGIDRLINFSDAVVAVAITLLVLPLVELRPEEGQTFTQLVSANAAQVWVFVFTFFLVGVLWLAHHRVLNGARAYDGTIFWLTIFWLACLALLPWLSALMGENGWSGDQPDGTIYAAFWGALALASFTTAAMSDHLRRHPSLLEPAVANHPVRGPARFRGLIFGLFFVALALLSLASVTLAQWVPLLIIPLSFWLRRSH